MRWGWVRVRVRVRLRFRVRVGVRLGVRVGARVSVRAGVRVSVRVGVRVGVKGYLELARFRVGIVATALAPSSRQRDGLKLEAHARLPELATQRLELDPVLLSHHLGADP